MTATSGDLIADVLEGAEVVESLAHEFSTVATIIFSFNSKEFLSTSIESALAQVTSKRHSIIVHDDASTDGSQDVIRSYVYRYPDRVSAVLQGKNKYLSGVNLIAGLSYFSGADFICRLDADDVWISPDKVEAQVCQLESDASACLSHTAYVTLDSVRQQATRVDAKARILRNATASSLAHGNCIANPTVMFRTNCLPEFPPNFTGGVIQDWPLWTLIAARGRVVSLEEVTAVYRIHYSNAFAGQRNAQWRKETLRVQRMLGQALSGTASVNWKLRGQGTRLLQVLDRAPSQLPSRIVDKLLSVPGAPRRKTISWPTDMPPFTDVA